MEYSDQHDWDHFLACELKVLWKTHSHNHVHNYQGEMMVQTSVVTPDCLAILSSNCHERWQILQQKLVQAAQRLECLRLHSHVVDLSLSGV